MKRDRMHIRIIDYIGSGGGGMRFVGEIVRALAPSHDFELVSDGPALRRYVEELGGTPGLAFRARRPLNAWSAECPPRGVRLWRALGRGTSFHFEVPGDLLGGVDVTWFPWVHRHRLPAGAGAERVVGSLHDLIIARGECELIPGAGASERETLRRWLGSGAAIVASSATTVKAIEPLLGCDAGAVSVVPLSGRHSPLEGELPPLPAALVRREYLVCPANVSPHKNHEVLLDAFAAWRGKRTLVLTGGNTNLFDDGVSLPRARGLARRATDLGLVPGRDVLGLGFVSEPMYRQLLAHAWALVMPSTAEGGGSFPVWEALFAGVPVLCSDIPVLREMVGWTGGSVAWFDAHAEESLRAALVSLEANYGERVRVARGQVRSLHDRTWADVADEYAKLFETRCAAHFARRSSVEAGSRDA